MKRCAYTFGILLLAGAACLAADRERAATERWQGLAQRKSRQLHAGHLAKTAQCLDKLTRRWPAIQAQKADPAKDPDVRWLLTGHGDPVRPAVHRMACRTVLAERLALPLLAAPATDGTPALTAASLEPLLYLAVAVSHRPFGRHLPSLYDASTAPEQQEALFRAMIQLPDKAALDKLAALLTAVPAWCDEPMQAAALRVLTERTRPGAVSALTLAKLRARFTSPAAQLEGAIAAHIWYPRAEYPATPDAVATWDDILAVFAPKAPPGKRAPVAVQNRAIAFIAQDMTEDSFQMLAQLVGKTSSKDVSAQALHVVISHSRYDESLTPDNGATASTEPVEVSAAQSQREALCRLDTIASFSRSRRTAIAADLLKWWDSEGRANYELHGGNDEG